jgi:type VI secretion system secreted protein Hcp
MAVDIFLRIDGITGESQIANFKGQIQLESFSFGANNVVSIGAVGGSGSGKVSFSPITVTKLPDTASPLLFLAVCQGARIATATVSFVQSGASTAYITFDLGTVVVSGLTPSVTNGVPVETVTLVCGSLKYSVVVLNAAGAVTNTVSDGWDITKNMKL